MKIREVNFYTIFGLSSGLDFPVGNRQATQLDVYPEFNKQDWSLQVPEGDREVQAIYLEIRAENDLKGIFGPIELDQAYLIAHFLRPFLLDRDPLATELLYDQMIRLHRHGRSGLFMTAVSVVDCALWDLKGKTWGQPIYRLLGGPTRPSVPAYASMLGFSTEPEAAVAVALDYQSRGYSAQKWFFRYGPGDGAAGKEKNIALVQALRQTLGSYYPLMFDAYMGWDTTYACDMARCLEPYQVTWLEEPIPPEREAGFLRIKEAAKIPLATGEHVYTRWQVKELLAAGAVDYVQTDPDWTGGITELVKICALASAFDVPVVAHGHSLLAALHVAGAQSPNTVPMVEYLIRHQASKQFFHKPVYQPQNGSILLPDLPGLGLVLDENKIIRRSDLDF